MTTAIFSTKDFEKEFLSAAENRYQLNFRYLAESLNEDTADLANGCGVAVIFAGDDASAPVLKKLAAIGIRHLAIRAAGYDNIDLKAAKELNIPVANVPEYSPHAIAEHAVTMMLALNRKLILADKQVHTYNFSIGNLIGFDLNGKTAGIIGTGRIGSITARILHGFGCRLLGFDIHQNETLTKDFGLEYCELQSLCAQSDIISIHTCLTPETRYLINEEMINEMKSGLMLINTARGAVVETKAVFNALKRGSIGAFGMDVYENEKGVFFYNRSQDIPNDPILQELLSMPNVLITPHQAFATKEAIQNIAGTTCINIDHWGKGLPAPNELV